MAWRDLIVSSHPPPSMPPSKVPTVDIADKPSAPLQAAAQEAPPGQPLRASAPPAPETFPALPRPTAPLQPGWLVVYHSLTPVTYDGQVVYPLVGGCDDRAHGTVQDCEYDGLAWTVYLTDGTRLPLEVIKGVGRTNQAGEVVAAWPVHAHGYDGEGRR